MRAFLLTGDEIKYFKIMKSFNMFDLSKTYYYIVDTSYVIFCSAAAAFKDYVYFNDVLKTEMGPDFDPTIDPEFNIILKEKFISKIQNPVKAISPFTFDESNFIFAIDCPRKEIWRRGIFPEYKLSRDVADHSKDKFNIGKVFQYAYNKLIPDFCSETGSVQIFSTSAEADDIIAVLSKWIFDKDKNNHVIILSSDRDMVQLFNERTTILTISGELREPKKELETMTGKTKINEDISINASDFLLFKIIIGDGADNIPAIKNGLGPKRALKLILDKSKELLKGILMEDANIRNGFKRNKALISMNEIPTEIKELIIDNIEEVFSKKKQKTKGIRQVSSNDLLSDLI